mmetsp:Transcript_45746/g.74631  ORF Transcript_45746/g.74631 Transcript_45746/m.74631 type:complete len:225 (-) Transcript_45746:142-816(-)
MSWFVTRVALQVLTLFPPTLRGPLLAEHPGLDGVAGSREGVVGRLVWVPGLFEGVTGRFVGVPSLFEAVTSRLVGVPSLFEAVTSRLVGVPSLFEGVTGRLDGVANLFDPVTSLCEGAAVRLEGVNNLFDAVVVGRVVGGLFDGVIAKFTPTSPKENETVVAASFSASCASTNPFFDTLMTIANIITSSVFQGAADRAKFMPNNALKIVCEESFREAKSARDDA